MRARGSDRWLAVLASLRTTAALLLLLLVLLVLSVLIPQRSGVTLAAHDAWAAAGGIRRFLLIDLELGHVPTSRIFLVSLGLFFANLLAVLGERTGVALRRCRFVPPTAAAARELSRRDGAIAIAASEGGMSRAAAVLNGLGYRTFSAEGMVWGVKNRFSPLGFPLFHLSFFVLWAAGSLLYYTRSVGILSAIEGQWVETASAHVVTRAPAGPPPSLR
ncbi:MAG TPA: cytochrome c biogenesis protein ResB, partial [Anaeromyxobacteraceae bacterium]|nr:cytochrome c biogenesis protein ResB [Anaeromyxobacteraceae bacterium]